MIDFINSGLKKSDFVKREAHYKVCDACAVVTWQYRNRVDYVSLNKQEGGRFDYVNLGLCERHYQELANE